MKTASMSAAGIMKGDLVIASPTMVAANNDIIIASVNSGTWLHRLLRIGETTLLVPADPAHPNAPRIIILPTDRFLIRGVVLCSIHALRKSSQEAILHHAPQANLNQLLGLHLPSVYCSVVSGQSMEGAGIFNQDILIVDRSCQAVPNDIIIANVNRRFYVKRFIRAQGSVYLLSDNPRIPPLPVPPAEFQVWGSVLFSLHLVHQLMRQRLFVQRSGGR